MSSTDTKYNYKAPSTAFKKGHKPWCAGKKGSCTGIPHPKMKGRGEWMKGKQKSEETKEKIRQTLLKNKQSKEYYKNLSLKGYMTQQQRKLPTSIEKAVYDFLVLKGIIFEKQKLINGKFVVDAYIPSLNLVIEADGSYWHNLERVKKHDKAKNAYFKRCGINLIRLSEEEIKSGKFKERLVI
ncbi:MAG TPA: DUF559 domain-containing protein [Patescibacteria group bacterium]